MICSGESVSPLLDQSERENKVGESVRKTFPIAGWGPGSEERKMGPGTVWTEPRSDRTFLSSHCSGDCPLPPRFPEKKLPGWLLVSRHLLTSGLCCHHFLLSLARSAGMEEQSSQEGVGIAWLGAGLESMVLLGTIALMSWTTLVQGSPVWRDRIIINKRSL